MSKRDLGWALFALILTVVWQRSVHGAEQAAVATEASREWHAEQDMQYMRWRSDELYQCQVLLTPTQAVLFDSTRYEDPSTN